ncbi:hypothetical protein EV401DRAFT_2079448 [Pisolithus croceorrhizus]|nr:hypothetical protein EV401DRAFT_2079448 [Pisolithus croceorrhizus]
MINRLQILVQWSAHRELLDHKMDDMDWQVLQDVEVVLEIPHAAQQSMSGESTPKLSGAIPAFETFIEEWKGLSDAVPCCAAYMGKTKPYVVAMFVNPTIHFTWIREHWPLLNAAEANQMTEYRRQESMVILIERTRATDYAQVLVRISDGTKLLIPLEDAVNHAFLDTKDVADVLHRVPLMAEDGDMAF